MRHGDHNGAPPTGGERAGAAGSAVDPAAPSHPPAPSGGKPLADHSAVLTAAAGVAADRLAPLAALRLLAGLRASLDEAERQLIGAARDERASWVQIAAALGLTSRQAAEQRWLRLSGATTRDPGRVRTDRRRQQSVDKSYGAAVVRLRAEVVAVHRRLTGAADRDAWHPRARLALTTLGLAGSAEPGALYALTARAIEDLDLVPAERLTPPLPDAAHRLRRAIVTATPAPHGEPGGS